MAWSSRTRSQIFIHRHFSMFQITMHPPPYVNCLFSTCLSSLIYYEFHGAHTKSKYFKEVRHTLNSKFHCFLLVLEWTALQTWLGAIWVKPFPLRLMTSLPLNAECSGVFINSVPAEAKSQHPGSLFLWAFHPSPSVLLPGPSWAATLPTLRKGPLPGPCIPDKVSSSWPTSSKLPWKQEMDAGCFVSNPVNSQQTTLPLLKLIFKRHSLPFMDRLDVGTETHLFLSSH